MAFLPSEYRKRINDVKSRMDRSGLDLLICQDPANMSWLTGYDGWSFYTPQAVLVHGESEDPIWFGRKHDSVAARITTFLPDSNIVGFTEGLLHHKIDHPFDELCALIQSKGWAKDHIGLELDAHYFTARAYRHLVQGLPNAEFVDSHELVNWARLVKSDAEMRYMREAGQIVSHTMRQAIARIKPGVPDSEIVAGVYHDQVSGLDGNFGDYTSLCPLIQIGEGTKTSHLTWTGTPIPESGVVVMELAAARRHYHTPLTRTVHVGKPPEEIVRLASVIAESGNLALEAAKPGATCEEVEAVWQKSIRKYGYSKDTRVGYSIGINYPPDWGERTASLRPADRTVLHEGMCFHFQSGIWLDSFGAAISESFVVAESGGERLCNVDRQLFVL